MAPRLPRNTTDNGTDNATDEGHIRYQNLLHGDLTHVVLGAFYQVHQDLSRGHLESVYANAIAVALREAGLDVRREAPISVVYHGQEIGFFRADLLIEGKLIAEAKVADAVTNQHLAQVINYLRSSDLELALVLAFGDRARFKRVLLDNEHKPRWRSSANSRSSVP